MSARENQGNCVAHMAANSKQEELIMGSNQDELDFNPTCLHHTGEEAGPDSIPTPADLFQLQVKKLKARCLAEVQGEVLNTVYIELANRDHRIVAAVLHELTAAGLRAYLMPISAGGARYLVIEANAQAQPAEPVSRLRQLCIQKLHQCYGRFPNKMSVDIGDMNDEAVEQILLELRYAGWSVSRLGLRNCEGEVLLIQPAYRDWIECSS